MKNRQICRHSNKLFFQMPKYLHQSFYKNFFFGNIGQKIVAKDLQKLPKWPQITYSFVRAKAYSLEFFLLFFGALLHLSIQPCLTLRYSHSARHYNTPTHTLGQTHSVVGYYILQ